MNLNEGWLSPEAARDSHSKPKPKLLQGELLQLTVARGRVLANASLTHSMHSLTQQLSCTQLCRVAFVWATEFSISCRCFWGFPSCPSNSYWPSPASDEMHKMHKLNLFNILNSFIAKYAYKMANADVRRCMQRGNAFNFQLCQLNLACAPEPIKSQQAKNKLKFAQVLLLLFKCCCCPFVVLFLFLLLNFLFVLVG